MAKAKASREEGLLLEDMVHPWPCLNGNGKHPMLVFCSILYTAKFMPSDPASAFSFQEFPMFMFNPKWSQPL